MTVTIGVHSPSQQQRLQLINFYEIADRLRIRERVGMNNQIINYSLKRILSGFCSTALITCLLVGGSNAFAQTSYKVTDLGVLRSKKKVVPAAVNAQGLVAGTSSAQASGEAAFRYNPNIPTPME